MNNNVKCRKKRRFSTMHLVLGIILFIYSVLMLYMLCWGIINSLKTYPNFHDDPVGFPKTWEFVNYAKAFSYLEVPVDGVKINVIGMFVYSILYAVGGALISALVQCITAYLCVQFPCKFSSVLYGVVIVTMAIPIIGSESSTLLVLTKFGLYNTMTGSWLLKSYFIGVYFLVFYNTFKGISPSYREAAQIDGAGNIVVTVKIMLPLVKNIFFTIFLLNFISLWNDYSSPLLYMPAKPTIAYGVWYYSTSQDNEIASIPMKLAGCMLMLLPILLVFVLFSNRLLAGVSMGGVKE